MSDAMGHETYEELLAGATLDDLDLTEREALEAHRAGCRECAAATESLDAAAVALAMAVPQRQPSPGLESRIMAAVAAEPRGAMTPASTEATGAPAATAPSVAERPSVDPDAGRGARTSWWRRPQFAMAAGALAVVLAVTTLALALQTAGLRSTVALQDAAIAVLADPDGVAAPLLPEDPSAGVTAMAVFVPGTTESYVMATGLPPTPSGEVYQLWSADAAGVHPLGTYTYDGTGTFVAPFGVDLSQAAAAMITVEPTGGATGEPGPQVVFGELGASES